MTDDDIKTLEEKIRSLDLNSREGLKERTRILNRMAQLCNPSNHTSLEKYITEAIALAKKKGFNEELAASYRILGVSLLYRRKYDEALRLHFDALKILEKLEDTHGIAVCSNNIGIILRNQNDYSKAYEYHLKALDLYSQNGDKCGMADSYNNMGNNSVMQGDFANALENHLKALRIREEIGDRKETAVSLNNVGAIYIEQGDYDKALEYQLSALKIREEALDNHLDEVLAPQEISSKREAPKEFPWNKEESLLLAASYNNVGSLYTKREDYDKALEYQLKALKIRERFKDNCSLADSYNNVGNIYRSKGDYKEALRYCMDALEFYKESGSKHGMARTSCNIGAIYFDIKDYEKSLEYNSMALEISRGIGDKLCTLASLRNIGTAYYRSGDYETALKHLDEALSIARETGAKDWEMSCFEGISNVHERTGDYLRSLEAFKKYSELRDEIRSKESSKNIARLEVRYETEKKKREAEIYKLKTVELEERVERRTAQLAAANLELKNQIAERERMELELVRSAKLASLGVLAAGIAHQINNPLAIISSTASSLFLKMKRIDASTGEFKNDIVGHLDTIESQIRRATGIISGLLAFARNEESKIVSANVNLLVNDTLQMLLQRFDSNGITINIELDKSLPHALADPEALRQVIANVIQNALEAMEAPGELAVSTSLKENKRIQILVHDSGPGIPPEIGERIFDPLFSTKTKSKGTGLGLSLSVLLLERFGGRIRLLESDRGARFAIDIPANIEERIAGGLKEGLEEGFEKNAEESAEESAEKSAEKDAEEGAEGGTEEGIERCSRGARHSRGTSGNPVRPGKRMNNDEQTE